MRVKYSCLVDNQEKYQKQGWFWLNSLIYFGKINPSDIFMHCVKGTGGDYIEKCAATGVNVEITEPFGDKKYCNKIAQMATLNENEKLKDSDAVILLDTDMIMLENFEHNINFDCVGAKIVDLPNPETPVIDGVFKLAGLKKSELLPDKKVECREDYLTYGANFNGGLYIIPRKYYGVIKSGWEKWSRWLLEKENGKPLYDAGKEAHIDQVSFCMAMHENNIPVNYLGLNYNYSLPYDFGDIKNIPYVLHYHICTDENNLLSVDYKPAGNIKKAIESANEFIISRI